MKILIYGAGPFGSLFAERLSEANHEVSLLDIGERLRELREHGVVIKDHSTEELTVTKVKVVEALLENDDYDLIIVPMRKNKAIKILPVLAKNRKVPTILFMMNSAEGSDQLVEALGKERVMIGFPLPGGKREGHVMRMLSVNEENEWPLPIGEVDGAVRERTKKIADVLASMRGYKVDIRKDMDDWLKCHVAILIVSFVPAAYATGLDLERFERTQDAIILAIRGQREAFKALRSVGVKMSPAAVIKFLEWTPEPLMIPIWRKALGMEIYQVSFAHLEEAEDEMRHLHQEFMQTIKESDVPTPHLDELGNYFDPQTPLMPDGSRDISINWTGVKRVVVGAGVVTLISYLVKRNYGK